jgi:hypothetical protein
VELRPRSNLSFCCKDQDTDRYVFEVLKPEYRLAIKELQGKVQWTDLWCVVTACIRAVFIR